jgi:hypothetical protein
MGTAIVNGAIIFNSGSSLEGRALSKAGAISLTDNTVTLSPPAEAAGTITRIATTIGGKYIVPFDMSVTNNITIYSEMIHARASYILATKLNPEYLRKI